jgi:hypothetical protein
MVKVDKKGIYLDKIAPHSSHSGSPNSSTIESLVETKIESKRNLKEKRELRVARTLSAVTIAYVICVAPQVVYNTVVKILVVNLNKPHLKGPLLMHKCFLWLIICNSLVNPIIYSCFNREFVATFHRMKSKILSFC